MAVGILFFRALLSMMMLGLYFYVSHQLIRYSSLPLPLIMTTLLVLGVMFSAVLSMPLYFWSVHFQKLDRFRRSALHLAHYSLAYLNFLLPLILLRDMYSFVVTYFFAVNADSFYGYESYLILITLPCLLNLIGFLPICFGPLVHRKNVVDKRLPHEFDQLKIAHISDLHVSMFLIRGFVDRLLRRLEKLEADLVVMTGDIIDGPVEDNWDDIQKLKKISAPLGVFYVPGNHEYYWGVQSSLRIFTDFQFQVLMNRSVAIQRGGAELLVSGVPDPAGDQFKEEDIDLDLLTKDFKENQYRLLLSHQPRVADLAVKKAFHFQFSGHTHGGQFFPWNLLIYCFERYNRGHYKVRSEEGHQMHLYVNQGTGYWGPALRLGTECELTLLTLSQN